MPNGVDKNYWRLAIACAAFRERYGIWPTEARVAPIVLWDFGQIFDDRNFELLCSRLQFRTTGRTHIAVGDANVHLVYDKLDPHPDPVLVDEAIGWLGARIRPEFEHVD